MILASHQPDFFPYMGFFYKIFQSDAFVFSDDVQFSKSGMHNYNSILTRNGLQRITIPIHYEVKPIKDIKVVADQRCIEKILKTICMAYSKASHFKEVYPWFEQTLYGALKYESLATFNVYCILATLSKLQLEHSRSFFLSSWLGIDSHKDERILDLCKTLKADVYLSGIAAKAYHVEDNYSKNGIELRYTDYQPVKYKQIGKGPADNLSVIDYMMNCGFRLPKEWARW